MSGSNPGSAGTGAPTGDQPQQGVPSAPMVGNQSGPTTPAPGAPTDPQSPAAQQQQEANNPAAQRYAQEAAAERKARQAIEAELKALKDGQLSDLEKAQQKAQEYELKNSEWALRVQRTELKNAINDARAAAGISASIPAEHLARLVDGLITFDSENNPLDVVKALKELVKDNRYLASAPTAGTAGTEAGTQIPGAPPVGAPGNVTSGGPVNPGKGGTPSNWTWDLIAQMNPTAYNALSKQQQSEMAEFIMRNPRPLR